MEHWGIDLYLKSSEGVVVADSFIEAGPGFAIAAIGFLARKLPRTIGVLVLVATALLLFVILRRGLTVGQVATAAVIGVPLGFAAVCLSLGDRDASGPERGLSEPPALPGQPSVPEEMSGT